MKRTILLALTLMLITAACGGSDEEGEPTGSTASPSTDANEPAAAPQPANPAAPLAAASSDPGDGAGTADPADPAQGSGSSTSFCGFVSSIDTAQPSAQPSLGPGFDPTSFQVAMEESVAAIRRARDLAPGEIAADVQYLLDSFSTVVELYEEYEWDLVEVATSALDDPRLTSLDEEALDAATSRIGAFCGLDLTGHGNGDPIDEGSGPGDVPANLPDALIPPGVTASEDIENGSFTMSSSASFNEILAFFNAEMGDPIFLDEGSMTAVWNDNVEGKITSVNAQGVGGSVEIVIAILG